MSLYDYKKSIELHHDESVSFYSLIMAAILRADSRNSILLRQAFPDTFDEVHKRYWSPGGELSTDGQERIVITQLTEEDLQDMVDQHKEEEHRIRQREKY